MRTHTDGRAMVRLDGVTKARAQGESVFELVVPDFAVHAGEVVAVVGPSGCGKSTLLDMIALVMMPSSVRRFEIDAGATGGMVDVRRLWVQGDEAALAALRRDHLGYVLQTGGLLPFLSVRDNIGLPGRIKGLRQDRPRIDRLARRLGLQGCLDRMPASLSIGQRQRAAILRALAHRPRLVLADEPTAAVDKARARSIIDDMEALARDESVAVVVVTHDVELVVGRADRIYTFDLEQVSDQATRSFCRQVGRAG
ncbi:MAG: ATP-binding cassette domain-containing protein [Rhodocyclaceae bacterium]|nr:ATP-binding cassette domain-containing protein [Rhodocyclaceae bacterium]